MATALRVPSHVPGCVAFLRKTMRVREKVVLVCLSHSDGFAQKRNASGYMGRLPAKPTVKKARSNSDDTRDGL